MTVDSASVSRASASAQRFKDLSRSFFEGELRRLDYGRSAERQKGRMCLSMVCPAPPESLFNGEAGLRRRPATTGVPPAEINRGLIIIILFSRPERPSSRAAVAAKPRISSGSRFLNSWEKLARATRDSNLSEREVSLERGHSPPPCRDF